MMTAP